MRFSLNSGIRESRNLRGNTKTKRPYCLSSTPVSRYFPVACAPSSYIPHHRLLAFKRVYDPSLFSSLGLISYTLQVDKSRKQLLTATRKAEAIIIESGKCFDQRIRILRTGREPPLGAISRCAQVSDVV